MVDDIGAPIDVLWMRLTRRPSDGAEPLGRMIAGKVLVMIDRGDYWQCAYVIAKGGYEAVKAAGLDAFRAAIAEIAPQMHDRVGELAELGRHQAAHRHGRPVAAMVPSGLLCIGDAAHAMSPVGGVGINLAVQDAVATANMLAGPLRAKTLTLEDLAAVQQRRTFPTRATQWLQVQIQNRILTRVLKTQQALSPPWPLRVVDRCPWLQGIPARIVGVGFRPEHVRN